LVCFRFI